ncbi:MAG: selenocysteine-specific translation elongation factor [Desulfobacterales bacterium]
MKQIILGTAGHIDHGKTSLVKALTGTDTDRLKEEKLRGITIELGFAALDLPSGQHVGIVDVPGHEKFVKNMVAGATGIDIVAMVIAADEGVMPQTREHMEICTLLGVSHGFVAITKIDMVDEEWLELAMEDVREFTRGTFLEEAPIVPVSSVTGQGIDAFIATLDEICNEIPARKPSSLFRLPVDRVFTIKGFGTVITGSLASGRVEVGQTVMLYPSMISSKVRGIQVHGAHVSEAHAGQRTAINFQGLEKAAIQRGEVLAVPDSLKPSYMVDLSFHYLESNRKPLRNRVRVRFHTGTSEVMGNLILLEGDDIQPGSTVMSQIRLDQPVTLVKDDRFVVRSLSPVRTIGGGRVLNPIPPKHKRLDPVVIDALRAMAEQPAEESIPIHAKGSGFRGATFNDLRLATNLGDKPLEASIGAFLSRKTLIQIDKDNRLYVHADSFDAVRAVIRETLAGYHAAQPLKPGMPREELKSKLPRRIGIKLFTLAVNQMVKDGEIAMEADLVRLADHRISLGIDQETLKSRILDIYVKGGIMPPYFKDVIQELDIDSARGKDVLMLLVQEGRLVKVKEDLYFDEKAIRQLREKLVAFLREKGEITTPEFKDMAGASRKYVIPLAEYFDACQVTLRVGDVRKLRKG